MGRIRCILPLLALACLPLGLPAAASSERWSPTSLRITKLDGSVVRLGTMDGTPLFGVRLRPTVCFGSPSEALKAYPSRTILTHFEVTRSPKTWWAARTVIDHPVWLVPFGETWGGKACGLAQFEDPLPPGYYDAVAFGSPNACYGVEFTLWVGKRHATRRAILRCPPLPVPGR